MYQPPRLSREEAAFRNLICKRRGPVAFDWLGAAWRLQLGLSSEAPGELNLEAEWGGARVLLKVDRRWVDQVVRALVPEANLTALPEPLMLAILESAFASLSELIGNATRKRFRIVAVDTAFHDTAGLTRFGFRMEREGETVSGEILFDALGMGFLAGALRQQRVLRDVRRWTDIEVPLRFTLGWTTLPLAALRGIEPHDVILLDECWGANQQLRVKVGKGRVFGATWKGTTMKVTSGLEEALDDEGDARDDVEGDAGELDDLEVRLTFDLGERSITFGALQELGAGHTFDLGRELSRAVTIRANGKAIGVGELVDLDGRLGVSVLEFRAALREGE